jgi:hypothetical protein
VLLDQRSSSPGSTRDSCAGTVVETLFHGNTLRLKLSVGAGAPFAVDLPLRATLEQTRPPMAGAVVALNVDPANVIVFPAERRA